MSHLSRISIACLLLLPLVGCTEDEGRIEVRGRVTSAGMPVGRGKILLIPQEGIQGPSASGVITEGEYEIPADRGPTAGRYEIRITTGVPAGPRSSEDAPAERSFQFARDIDSPVTVMNFDLP